VRLKIDWSFASHGEGLPRQQRLLAPARAHRSRAKFRLQMQMKGMSITFLLIILLWRYHTSFFYDDLGLERNVE